MQRHGRGKGDTDTSEMASDGLRANVCHQDSVMGLAPWRQS